MDTRCCSPPPWTLSTPWQRPSPPAVSSREFHRYLKPAVLIVDELGYLPIDKHGADLLFQIISQRYERAPMVITTNRAYKHWSQIFNKTKTRTAKAPPTGGSCQLQLNAALSERYQTTQLTDLERIPLTFEHSLH